MTTPLSDSLRVDISAFIDSTDLDIVIAAGFVPGMETPFREVVICFWSFYGSRLGELFSFRNLLEKLEVEGSESWSSSATRTLQDATLFLLDFPLLKGAKIEPDLLESIHCSTCGRYYWNWVPFVGKPILHLPQRDCPEMFELEAGTMTIVSLTFLKTLQTLKLVQGLEWFETEVYPVREESYFILKPTTSIGWPVAPFGYREGPCDVCGHFLGQYNIFRIYNKPARGSELDWMTVANLAPTRLVVRAHVFDHLQKYISGIKRARLGWSPEEVEQAFAPVQYRTL